MIAKVITNIYKLTSLVQAVIFGGCLLISTAATAATYYVATTGSDSNPGTLAEPFRTIGKGTSSLKSGDTLYIRGGTYDEQIRATVPGGTPSQPTIISGFQSENPIIKPSQDYARTKLAVYSFGQSGQDYITWQNFTIDLSLIKSAIPGTNDGSMTCLLAITGHIVDGITCKDATRDGFALNGDNIIVRNSTVLDCGRVNPSVQAKGLGLHGSGSNILVEGNLISGCRGGGIDIDQNSNAINVIVRNNVIRHFGTDSTWPQTPGTTPDGTPFDAQGAAGIVFSHGTNFYAYNNLIYNTGHASGNGTSASYDNCFYAWGPQNGAFFYNNTCYIENPNGAVYEGYATVKNVVMRNNMVKVPRILGPGNATPLAEITNTEFVTNPNFAGNFSSPTAKPEDFKLAQGSPGINQGANLSSVFTTDFAGVSRGSSFDVGAYEYVGSGGGISRPGTPVNLQVSR